MLQGKEEKPQMFGTSNMITYQERDKFKSPFGEPPVVEKKRQYEPNSARKRKPVSFFDPARDRTIHNDEDGEEEESPLAEGAQRENIAEDRPQEVPENINIETSENINLGTFGKEAQQPDEPAHSNKERSPLSEDYQR